jgi:hypothetical protein
MRLAALALMLGAAVLGGSGAAVQPAGTMTAPRAAHTATALADGRVLLVGGMGGGEASAEVFDPKSGRFRRTGSPLVPRIGHAAARLADGRVLVLGGWTQEGGRLLRSAELYDPRTARFSTTGPLVEARGGAAVAKLRGGRVLVVGGNGDGRVLRTAELYDPRTGRFRRVGSLASPRGGHTAVRLADGRVLVIGGSDGRGRVLASAEVFDPRSGRFRRAGRLRTPRHKHAAALLRDGRVLVVGGSSARDWHGRYASAELWLPRRAQFVAARAMTARRFKLADAVARLGDGRVVVAGGADAIETFDARTGRFRVLPGHLGVALSFSTATALPGGAVLVAGGYDERIRATVRAWVVRQG